MPDIIRKSRLEHRVEYMRYFEYAHEKGWGFSFTCDKIGRVRRSRLAKAALENYKKCLSGSVDGFKVIDKGVQTIRSTIHINAIIRCECGAEVELWSHTVVCDKCHRYYNGSGQPLSDPRFWGEETGESVTEIMMADFNATNY